MEALCGEMFFSGKGISKRCCANSRGGRGGGQVPAKSPKQACIPLWPVPGQAKRIHKSSTEMC